MTKKRFPTGIQTFADIRNSNYYYVDKTSYILELVKEKYIFLSRPRRFGKSLTLDTIDNLFSGNQALFMGLYAEKHWDWDRTYPVIRLGFAGGILNEEKKFVQDVQHQLIKNAEKLSINLDRDFIEIMFKSLIEQTVAIHNQPVVLLIDEYDKPILDNLPDNDQAMLMRNLLRDLYSVIKEQDKNIRFAMLTGVSKFSKVNLFSGLNNLTDVTLSEQFSALCGYTQNELETVFVPELENVDLAQVQRWYNGYNWTGESVYNPYDVMLFLADNRHHFKSYWFETGSPTFLADKVSQDGLNLSTLNQKIVDNATLSQFEVGNISPIALMFQTGYLTIDTLEQDFDGVVYTLKFPNLEVQQSFNTLMLNKYLNSPDDLRTNRSLLRQNLLSANFEQMQIAITAFIASIPYNWHSNNNIAHFEGYWASVFFALFASLGFEVRTEEATNQGRIDMVVTTPIAVYIFEFKMIRENSDIGSALAQIYAKNYAQKYQVLGKTVYEVGVEFDEKSREVRFDR